MEVNVAIISYNFTSLEFDYERIKSTRTKRMSATLYQIELLMVIHLSIYQRYVLYQYENIKYYFTAIVGEHFLHFNSQNISYISFYFILAGIL